MCYYVEHAKTALLADKHRQTCIHSSNIQHQHMFSRHSPHSRKAMRSGAFHFVANCVILFLCLWLLLYGMIYRSFDILRISLALTLFWLLSVCLFYSLFRSSTCPNCLSRVWSKKGTRVHQDTARFMGLSSRLSIAVSVILSRKFQCPDCSKILKIHKKTNKRSRPDSTSSVY